MIIIILIFSFFGYSLLFCKLGSNPVFTPVLSVSTITSVLFIGGLLNLLNASFFLVLAVGLILFIILCLASKEYLKKLFLVYLFFIILCALLYFRLDSIQIFDIDDSRHWALIAKYILQVGRFPCSESVNSSIIVFKGYITGAATWIYFICRLFPFSDSLMLFAQSIAVVAGCFPLLAFVKKSKLYQILGATACFVYLIYGINVGFAMLRVDNLLTVIAFAAFAISWYYKDDRKTAIFLSIPIQIFLVSIKTAGLFFAYANILSILLFTKKEKGNWWTTILAVLIPVGIQLSWNMYIRFSFPEGLTSYHSPTLEHYLNVVQEKTFADIVLICKPFFQRLFSINLANLCLFIAVLSFTLCIIINKTAKLNLSNNLKSIFLFESIVYVSYIIMLFMMYTFSMPTSEAKEAAGFTRYYMSIAYYCGSTSMLLFFGFSDQFLKKKSEIPPKYAKAYFAAAVILMTVSLFFAVYKQRGLLIKEIRNDKYENKDRVRIEKIIKENAVHPDDNILLYAEDQIDLFLMRYILFSDNICWANGYYEMETRAEHYDRIIGSE